MTIKEFLEVPPTTARTEGHLCALCGHHIEQGDPQVLASIYERLHPDCLLLGAQLLPHDRHLTPSLRREFLRARGTLSSPA